MLGKDADLPAASRIVIDQAITEGAPLGSNETQEALTHVRRAGFAPEAKGAIAESELVNGA